MPPNLQSQERFRCNFGLNNLQPSTPPTTESTLNHHLPERSLYATHWLSCHIHASTKSLVFSEVRNCRLMKEVWLKLPETHIKSFGVFFDFPLFSVSFWDHISEARLKAVFRNPSRWVKHRFSTLFRRPFSLKSHLRRPSHARCAGEKEFFASRKKQNLCSKRIKDVHIGRHYVEKNLCSCFTQHATNKTQPTAF